VSALACLLALLRAADAEASRSPRSRTGFPRSVAVLGDSMSTAALSSRLERNQWENSWATGGNAHVQSHYLRLRAVHPPEEVSAFHAAVSGQKMAHLDAQAQRVVAEQPEYVTILMGANDVCAQREDEMTPVEAFRAQFEAAMRTLTRGVPDARLYVVSIPDVRRLYDLFRENPAARLVWGLASFCPTMLGNPGSTAPADEARRERVRQRIRDYNRQLEEVCAQHLHCRFDGNALFDYVFAARDVSGFDHFHPSEEGQRQIAAASWRAGYDFRDAKAPESSAVPTLTREGMRVELQALDDVGVKGLEYQLEDGTWQRYERPLLLGPAGRLVFRAVDVNGNVEAAQAYEAPEAFPGLVDEEGVGPKGDLHGLPVDEAEVGSAGCAVGGAAPAGPAAWGALAVLLAWSARQKRSRGDGEER
jgi:MYXO-CTERM domain-containing protein